MASLLEDALYFLDSFERISQQDNGEKLVPFLPDKSKFIFQQSPWSFPFLLGNHYLRESVLEKLHVAAATILKATGPNYKILIMDTYRPPPVQETNFTVLSLHHGLHNLGKFKSLRELRAYTNMFVAIPEFAPHPCGAAIDMTLYDVKKGKSLVFGEEQLGVIFGGSKTLGTAPPPEYLKQLYETMCEGMKAQEFIMTPCEWWHFAYGDSEWATFKNQPATLYKKVPYKPSMAMGLA